MLFLSLGVISIIAAIYFFIRLLVFKKEVKKMSEQLRNYNKQSTNKKLDMALLDKNMEAMGVEINELIDLHMNEKRDRIRFETELKQTITNMSHDLRTPLTSILGYIQLAESEDTPKSKRMEYISIAKERAKRLEALLHDFFELSLIESTEYQLKSESFSMKNLIIDVLMSFFDRFNERGWEPEIQMPENDVIINADKSAVTRIIENLISNAINHSDGNISISLQEGASTVRLEVMNDAYRLTEHDVDHFFDRFYKADPSRSGKSTGLGLSIVKSFMQKMNGKVTATLKDGKLAITCEWKV
ncbi:sensor histidine kinase [Lederbergia graminis]|uniref:histidine kinase n=1 Tax=Lederbergia graminis TaxID=735518 RepID=A0ABW0LH82_9BACI|nr:HAMP domain-containing sensor histidine kinase [Paenibacillus bovis]HLU23263.1 HAMP domain-containing sensor histidine kinase [Bacillaceae bacterium]